MVWADTKDAQATAQEAATDPLELGRTKWALAELVEAAMRSRPN